jgi:energy-coupling factor transporter ATP-binding protein EcfA2
MLLQFTVENFRSFAGKQVLSLLARPGEQRPAGQAIDVPGLGSVLRTAAVYGPNASGKSALMQAFGVLQELVVDGIAPGRPLPVVSHKRKPEWESRPTTFEVELWLDGAHYAYGIRATRARVLAEWLIRVEGETDHVIFEREDTDGPRPRVTFGPGLAVDERRRMFYGFVAEGTRHEQPLLAELRARNATELVPVFEFFLFATNSTATIEWDEPGLIRWLLQIPDLRETMRALLKAADTGVTGLELVCDDPAIQGVIDAERVFSAEDAVAARDASSPVRLRFLSNTCGSPCRFELRELSDGTRRLLWFAPFIAVEPALGTTRFVDELDRSLHTQLTRFLIQQLNSSEGRGQLIFTTHDTNLLDANVLGRDAIWFVQRDAEGASQLYSLAEFDKSQLDALQGHMEEGYLAGRFGAIPFLGDPTRLGWSPA